MSERVSDHERQIEQAFSGRSADAVLLETVRGFRVEWDDGSVGIAGGMAVFVRTAGLGTGHRKLELLTGDDVVAILPEERRILVRTRLPPAVAIGRALRRALARRLGRLVRRGARAAAGGRPQAETPPSRDVSAGMSERNGAWR